MSSHINHYDYFISSRWRNKDAVLALTQKIRATGKTVYCFFEGYDTVDSTDHDEEAYMAEFEARDWRNDPQVKAIFDKDMTAQKASDIFIMLLPAGRSAHIEAGAAYGMGKKTILIGEVEKAESLYSIFDEWYKTPEEFLESLK
jgi:hypothetical protein